VTEISKSIRVERSLEDLADILGARPAEWLVPFASIAAHCGDAAGARHVGVLQQTTRRRVRRITVDLTDVPQTDDLSRVDAGLLWETSGFRWMFSTFEGRVVATRETDNSCIIAVEGSFKRPRSVGAADRAAVTVAVETATSMLLNTLRDAVEEQARASL
jgi:hypothetical protein